MSAVLADSRAKNPGIALCLSGGGFRSALFHLGALRRLHEVGLLHRVSLVSSVSGGSIVSGFFADRIARAGPVATEEDFSRWLDALDWEREIAAPFREIASRDFRTWPVLKNVLWNWAAPGFRVRDLERRYRRRITDRALKDVPRWPEFVFCATNLAFGVNWEFTRDSAGDYQAGYLPAGDWPLARAIAASSSFPPLFGPLSVRAAPSQFRRGRYRGPDRDRLLSRTELTDGGVYDNLGLEPAWKEYATVLVSDCGAPFEFVEGKNYLRRLLRYTAVVMNQAGSVRKRLYFYQRRRGEYGGTYWGIRSAADKSREVEMAALAEEEAEPVEPQLARPSAERVPTPGYPRELVDDCLARIRTDLDAFTLAERKVLENHGYFAANHSLTRYLGMPLPRSVPPSPPHPEWIDPDKVRHALRGSSKRISWFRLWQQAKGTVLHEG